MEMASAGTAKNGQLKKGWNLVTLGVLGLSRWKTSQVHQFRRELEGMVIVRFCPEVATMPPKEARKTACAAVPVDAKGSIRRAGYARAAGMRGREQLQNVRKGKLSMTADEIGSVEHRIASADRTEATEVAALVATCRPLDRWRLSADPIYSEAMDTLLGRSTLPAEEDSDDEDSRTTPAGGLNAARRGMPDGQGEAVGATGRSAFFGA